MPYEHIVVETRDEVGMIALHRPKVLNALNAATLSEIAAALDAFEADDEVGALVLTGSEKAFAAGIDLKERGEEGFVEAYLEDYGRTQWRRIESCRKPIVAAVAGYALGAGCELAMMCDFILAAENAKFGQPEITVGMLPSAGGTQRLARFVGKAKAMEMCLTGRQMTAEEAERVGLVSRVVPVAELVDEAVKTASRIAGMSRPIAMLTKEAVNRSYETGLNEGLLFERRMAQAVFAMEDLREGVAAFLEKRQPQFRHK